MEEKDAIEFYNLEKQRYVDQAPPYSKRAIEICVNYPITYYIAYRAIERYNEEELTKLLNMAYNGHGVISEKDQEDLIDFVEWTYTIR